MGVGDPEDCFHRFCVCNDGSKVLDRYAEVKIWFDLAFVKITVVESHGCVGWLADDFYLT